MAEIVSLHQRRRAKPTALADDAPRGEILFFTGICYCRTDASAPAPAPAPRAGGKPGAARAKPRARRA